MVAEKGSLNWMRYLRVQQFENLVDLEKLVREFEAKLRAVLLESFDPILY
jgi:hypothetical protein